MSRCSLVVAVVLALVLPSAACGTSQVLITDRIRVVPRGGSLPFDPTGARIRQAAGQLEAVAGHSLVFEIDLALFPSEGAPELLARMFEESAQDLEQEKRRRARAFAYGMPLIERVVCHYRATGGRRSEIESVDPATRTVTLVSGPDARLVPRDALSSAIEMLFARSYEERFRGVEPEAVLPADRADYFDFAIDVRTERGERDRSMSQPREPNPVTVDRALRLAAVVGQSDPALAGKLRSWLLRQMDDFGSAYRNEAPAVRALPPSAPWHRTEAAYGPWLTAQLPTLTDEEMTTVEGSAFIRDYGDASANANQTRSRRFAAFAFPGFDPFAFGLVVVDRWIRAGHPTENRYPFIEIVCPLEPPRARGSRTSQCRSHDWYDYALDTQQDTLRLADALVARKDPILTETVFTQLGNGAAAFTVLRRVEPDLATWEVGMRTLAHELDEAGSTWQSSTLVPEMRRLWRAYPARRGTILYVLAMGSGGFDPYYVPEGAIGWSHFTRDFEGGIGRSDFASFLAEDPNAVGLSQWLLPSRTKGWSPVELLVPRLDAYFALPSGTRTANTAGPDRLHAVIRQLCQKEHDASSLPPLKSWFQRYASSHPGDPLNTFMDSWTPKACHK